MLNGASLKGFSIILELIVLTMVSHGAMVSLVLQHVARFGRRFLLAAMFRMG